MTYVLIAIGYTIFAIGLLAYDEIKTKQELGEWKNDRAGSN